jgi:hypothetical protein
VLVTLTSPTRRDVLSRPPHLSSIRPQRQTDRAIAQVMTNSPTITKPSELMLMFSNQLQNDPDRLSSEASNPRSSIVPITTATATDRPVIVMCSPAAPRGPSCRGGAERRLRWRFQIAVELEPRPPGGRASTSRRDSRCGLVQRLRRATGASSSASCSYPWCTG